MAAFSSGITRTLSRIIKNAGGKIVVKSDGVGALVRQNQKITGAIEARDVGRFLMDKAKKRAQETSSKPGDGNAAASLVVSPGSSFLGVDSKTFLVGAALVAGFLLLNSQFKFVKF